MISDNYEREDDSPVVAEDKEKPPPSFSNQVSDKTRPSKEESSVQTKKKVSKLTKGASEAPSMRTEDMLAQFEVSDAILFRI